MAWLWGDGIGGTGGVGGVSGEGYDVEQKEADDFLLFGVGDSPGGGLGTPSRAGGGGGAGVGGSRRGVVAVWMVGVVLTCVFASWVQELLVKYFESPGQVQGPKTLNPESPNCEATNSSLAVWVARASTRPSPKP